MFNNNNIKKVSSGGCDMVKLTGSLGYCRTSQSLSLYISPREEQQAAFPNLFDHRILALWSNSQGWCSLSHAVRSTISATRSSTWKGMMNSCSLQGYVCSENRDLSVAPGYAFPRTVQVKNRRPILALRQDLSSSVMAPILTTDKPNEWDHLHSVTFGLVSTDEVWEGPSHFSSSFRVGDPLLGIIALILPQFLSGGISEGGVFWAYSQIVEWVVPHLGRDHVYHRGSGLGVRQSNKFHHNHLGNLCKAFPHL